MSLLPKINKKLTKKIYFQILKTVLVYTQAYFFDIKEMRKQIIFRNYIGINKELTGLLNNKINII